MTVVKLPPGSCVHAQAQEVDARLLGALLTGVRRAFPYVQPGTAEGLMHRHSQALFRISHTAPLGVGLQALALLFQLLTAQSAASDRFYRWGRVYVKVKMFVFGSASMCICVCV